MLTVLRRQQLKIMIYHESVKFLDEFIAKIKEERKQISIPRILIQKSTRDIFLEEANKIKAK